MKQGTNDLHHHHYGKIFVSKYKNNIDILNPVDNGIFSWSGIQKYRLLIWCYHNVGNYGAHFHFDFESETKT